MIWFRHLISPTWLGVGVEFARQCQPSASRVFLRGQGASNWNSAGTGQYQPSVSLTKKVLAAATCRVPSESCILTFPPEAECIKRRGSQVLTAGDGPRQVFDEDGLGRIADLMGQHSSSPSFLTQVPRPHCGEPRPKLQATSQKCAAVPSAVHESCIIYVLCISHHLCAVHESCIICEPCLTHHLCAVHESWIICVPFTSPGNKWRDKR